MPRVSSNKVRWNHAIFQLNNNPFHVNSALLVLRVALMPSSGLMDFEMKVTSVTLGARITVLIFAWLSRSDVHVFTWTTKTWQEHGGIRKEMGNFSPPFKPLSPEGVFAVFGLLRRVDTSEHVHGCAWMLWYSCDYFLHMNKRGSTFNVIFIHSIFINIQGVDINEEFEDQLIQVQEVKPEFHVTHTNRRLTDRHGNGGLGSQYGQMGDPVFLLMEYVRVNNLRLLDVFMRLDSDNDLKISHIEFQKGLQVSCDCLSIQRKDVWNFDPHSSCSCWRFQFAQQKSKNSFQNWMSMAMVRSITGKDSMCCEIVR